jgi:hypothetical protein
MLTAKQDTKNARRTQRRKAPADVIGNAVKVMRIATGEEAEDYGPSPESQGKDPTAVALGRKGGQARAMGLSKKRRREIAKQAAEKPWKSE